MTREEAKNNKKAVQLITQIEYLEKLILKKVYNCDEIHFANDNEIQTIKIYVHSGIFTKSISQRMKEMLIELKEDSEKQLAEI